MTTRSARLIAAAGAALLVTALAGCSFAAPTLPERDGAITQADDNADAFELQVGDCVNSSAVTSDEVDRLPVVPCSDPHEDEVYAVSDIPSMTFPGQDEVIAQADAIYEAAFEWIATRGYHATTFAAIAAEAGVSAETVKAGGSKSALLIAAFEMRFAGTESAPSLTDTEAGAGLMDLPDDVVLDAIVERIVAANARAYALWTVLLGAAGADELVAGALEEMLARRRADYRLCAFWVG